MAPNHEVDLSKLPDVSDISPETITHHVNAINSMCQNPRQKFVFERLVNHLHQFVSETNITTEEWMTGIQFLTNVGQTCTSIRQEFILLSDVLGVSALVDTINHPSVSGSTENTVLGPFFTDDAKDVPNGGSIASEGKGEYLLVEGRVLDTRGQPVANARMETWETDDTGKYDTQYSDRTEADCRGRLRTREDGSYSYRAVVPVAYPIPGDGPVGHLLSTLGRHIYRPAHLHVMIEAPGYETLVTALYPEGDKYLPSDAVFGVKKSLIVKLTEVNSDEEARAKGFLKGPFKHLQYDFILTSGEEAARAREQRKEQVTAELS